MERNCVAVTWPRPETITVVVVSLLGLILCIPSVMGNRLGEVEEAGIEELASGLVLELKTDKDSYSLDERIPVTVTIRNDGDRAFFITSAPRTISSAAGGTVDIEVVDAADQPLKGVKSFGEFWGLQGETLHSWLRKTRRLLLPGDFIGFSQTLERLGFTIEKPGRYRLRARYWETDYKEWATEQQIEEARKEILFPWWSGEIQSNEVWIEVR